MYAAFQKTFARAALLAWALLATTADGQVFRPRRVVPAQPVVTQPAPDQAVPGQQATQPADAAQGRVIRGRSLIGMNIWGPNQQQLGTIKDFIVDYQSGDCPTIFFAVTPQIAGWTGDYVIMPLNAFQVGFDARQRTDYFTLNMTTAELGRAPRLAAEKWNSAQDRQTFANARQYYQRMERTTARPETGGREQRPALPNTQQPGTGAPQQPQQPLQQQPQQRPQEPQKQPPAAGSQPPAGQQPEAPKPAPKPDEPGRETR